MKPRKRRNRRKSNMNEFIIHTEGELPSEFTDDGKTGTSEYNQWGIMEGSKFFPTFPTVQHLSSGYYELGFANNVGVYFERRNVSTDELFTLPSPELTDILDDIKTFWDREDKYTEYNFIHKRGILLYGRPGCGKSAIIQLCTKHLIDKMDGIVINISTMDQMDFYSRIIGSLRQVEPDRPIIVIMEDLDGLAAEGSWAMSLILNILDGIKQINNVVYIATTNHPEKLEERITNRPSRFDRRYEIALPNDEVRKAYFMKKLSEDDLKTIDVDEWVTRTHGLSISHLRELVISVVAMNNTFEDTMIRLDGMKRTPKVTSGSKSVGFS